MCAKPDLLFVESPPLVIAAAAWSLSKRWNCPYVANISDLWPESAIRMGIVRPGLLTWIAERVERRFYRQSVGVTGTSDGILEGVRQKSPGKRTLLVTNGVEPDRFGPDKATADARRLIGDEPGPVFLFAGLLGLVHGLDIVLDLAASLPADVPGRFVIVGDGPMREHLERRLREERIARVKLLPAQPRETIPALLACSDAVISTQGVVVPGAIPNKMYEAMAAGIPILMVSDGEAAERVLRAEAGLVSQPGDADALMNNYLKLVRDAELRERLGRAGRRAAEEHYSRSKIADGLHQFLLESITPS
jgi:glycosyltransferase involved in cell wall biosynthesis